MNKLFSRGQHRPFIYAAAFAFVGIVVLAFQQWPWSGPLAWPLLVLLLPVLGAAMIGGPSAALVAAGLSVMAADWFLLQPTFSFKVPGRLDASALLVYGVASGLIALVSQARHHGAVARAHASEWSRAASAEARRRRALGEVTART